MHPTNIKKVVIWGHKLHSHTHSYIHFAFHRAFKHLGYDTYWFDDSDDVSKFDFAGSLFLTEGQVDRNMPLRDDCFYILHNVDQGKYKSSSILRQNQVLVIQVFTKDCYKRGDPEIKHPCFHFAEYENNYPVLYFPWATDLLPHEIQANIDEFDKNDATTNDVYFIGCQTPQLMPVHTFCHRNGLNFKVIGGFANNNVDTTTNQQLIRQSIIAPAIQTTWQVDVGYVPCRIFKNISYGKMGITNSEVVYNLFEKKIIYHPDINQALQMGLAFERNTVPEERKNKVIELMNTVMENHTYLNRVEMILQCMFRDKAT